MLLDQIKTDVKESMKKGDKMRLETLRFLLAAIKNSAITKYGSQGESKVTDEDVLEIVKRQVKTHKESVEAFHKGGRDDLVAHEEAQLAILETFMPKQLSDEELAAILAPIASSGEANFGLLMKQAVAAVKGQADGSRISAKIKEMLQKS
ncbi:MAG: GatB/YqeY domain-containing protein [Firmicutes bacterium]|nr:GatB/YqeY domain-containing protein [Bacillota bacterium]